MRAHDVIDLLFDAEPMVHPAVIEAYEKAASLLRKRGIRFRPIGGIAMNLAGAGRPTRDVDLVVSRRDWHQAREFLQEIATDAQGIRTGLEGEPENGLALVGPHGVVIEVWPEGVTHEEIARLRGRYRPHRAGKLALTLGGDDRAALLNAKLASYLSATDRVKDAGDVQSLIHTWTLPIEFADNLDARVRGAYRRLWRGEV
ncbi:MAG: hypothetical protein O2960_22085 [Verrucomicrobia bacterium]|nr:hypothetical protein [Verrucomicrobiota bacterium]